MTIGDLPIGTLLYLGSVVAPYSRAQIDLMWMKVSEDNLFLLNNGGNIAIEMDAKESANSPSRQRRQRGSSFFPQTALFQWLNGSGHDWFQKCYETDMAPSYVGSCGFLTEFTDLERSVLVEQEIQIRTPEGFKKEFGVQTSCKCLVSLPSFSQVHRIRQGTLDADFLIEGSYLESVGYWASNMWTRSAQDGYMIITCGGNDYDRTIAPCETRYVYPIISLNPSAEVDMFNGMCVLKSADDASASPFEDSELGKILFG